MAKPQYQSPPKQVLDAAAKAESEALAAAQLPPEPPVPDSVKAIEEQEAKEEAALPPPKPIVHTGDTRSKAFQESVRTISITWAGDVQMKLLWGCNVGDVSQFVHALRDHCITEPESVLSEARKSGFGCHNCLTILTQNGRYPGAEPAKPDVARLAFRKTEVNHLMPTHRGPSQTVDLGNEKAQADRTSAAKK